MGLVSNVEISVVSNAHPGPFVINVKGSKVMLGRGMANKIMVSGCDNEKKGFHSNRVAQFNGIFLHTGQKKLQSTGRSEVCRYNGQGTNGL